MAAFQRILSRLHRRPSFFPLFLGLLGVASAALFIVYLIVDPSTYSSEETIQIAAPVVGSLNGNQTLRACVISTSPLKKNAAAQAHESLADSCAPDSVCEYSPDSPYGGFCVPLRSRALNEPCAASPSLCKTGLTCTLNLPFWNSEVVETAQNLNTLASMYAPERLHARKTFTTTPPVLPLKDAKGNDLQHAIAWPLVPHVSNILLEPSAVSCWTHQLLGVEAFLGFYSNHPPNSIPITFDAKTHQELNETRWLHQKKLTVSPLLNATCRLADKNSLLTAVLDGTRLEDIRLASCGDPLAVNLTSCTPWDAKTTPLAEGNHPLHPRGASLKCLSSTETPCTTDAQCPSVPTQAGIIDRICDAVKGVCTPDTSSACMKEFYLFQHYWKQMSRVKSAATSLAAVADNAQQELKNASANLVCCLQSLNNVIAGFSNGFNSLLSSTGATEPGRTFMLPRLNAPTPLALCRGRAYENDGWWIHTLLKDSNTNLLTKSTEAYEDATLFSSDDYMLGNADKYDSKERTVEGVEETFLKFGHDDFTLASPFRPGSVHNLTLVFHFAPSNKTRKLGENLYEIFGEKYPETQALALVQKSVSKAVEPLGFCCHTEQEKASFVTDLEGHLRHPRGTGTYLFSNDYSTLFDAEGFYITLLQVAPCPPTDLSSRNPPDHQKLAQHIFSFFDSPVDVAYALDQADATFEDTTHTRLLSLRTILDRWDLAAVLPGHNLEDTLFWLEASHARGDKVSRDSVKQSNNAEFIPLPNARPQRSNLLFDTDKSLPQTTNPKKALQERRTTTGLGITHSLEYVPLQRDGDGLFFVGLRNTTTAWIENATSHYPLPPGPVAEELFGARPYIVTVNATFSSKESPRRRRNLETWSEKPLKALVEPNLALHMEHHISSLLTGAEQNKSVLLPLTNDTYMISLLLGVTAKLHEQMHSALRNAALANLTHVSVAGVFVKPQTVYLFFNVWPDGFSGNKHRFVNMQSPKTDIAQLAGTVASALTASLQNNALSLWFPHALTSSEKPMVLSTHILSGCVPSQNLTSSLLSSAATYVTSECTARQGQLVLYQIDFSRDNDTEDLTEEEFRLMSMGIRWLFHSNLRTDQDNTPGFAELLDVQRRTVPVLHRSALVAANVSNGIVGQNAVVENFHRWLLNDVRGHILLFNKSSQQHLKSYIGKKDAGSSNATHDFITLFGNPSHLRMKQTTFEEWFQAESSTTRKIEKHYLYSFDALETVQFTIPHCLSQLASQISLTDVREVLRDGIAQAIHVSASRIYVEPFQPVLYYRSNSSPLPRSLSLAVPAGRKLQPSCSITITVSILPRLGRGWNQVDLEDRPARIARHALQRQVLVHPSFTLHPGILQQYSLYRFPLPPTLVDLPALQWLFLEQQAPPPILRLDSQENITETEDRHRAYRIMVADNAEPFYLNPALKKTEGDFLAMPAIYRPVEERPVPYYQTHQPRWLQYVHYDSKIRDNATRFPPSASVESVSKKRVEKNNDLVGRLVAKAVPPTPSVKAAERHSAQYTTVVDPAYRSSAEEAQPPLNLAASRIENLSEECQRWVAASRAKGATVPQRRSTFLPSALRRQASLPTVSSVLTMLRSRLSQLGVLPHKPPVPQSLQLQEQPCKDYLVALLNASQPTDMRRPHTANSSRRKTEPFDTHLISSAPETINWGKATAITTKTPPFLIGTLGNKPAVPKESLIQTADFTSFEKKPTSEAGKSRVVFHQENRSKKKTLLLPTVSSGNSTHLSWNTQGQLPLESDAMFNPFANSKADSYVSNTQMSTAVNPAQTTAPQSGKISGGLLWPTATTTANPTATTSSRENSTGVNSTKVGFGTADYSAVLPTSTAFTVTFPFVIPSTTAPDTAAPSSITTSTAPKYSVQVPTNVESITTQSSASTAAATHLSTVTPKLWVSSTAEPSEMRLATVAFTIITNFSQNNVTAQGFTFAALPRTKNFTAVLPTSTHFDTVTAAEHPMHAIKAKNDSLYPQTTPLVESLSLVPTVPQLSQYTAGPHRPPTLPPATAERANSSPLLSSHLSSNPKQVAHSAEKKHSAVSVMTTTAPYYDHASTTSAQPTTSKPQSDTSQRTSLHLLYTSPLLLSNTRTNKTSRRRTPLDEKQNATLLNEVPQRNSSLAENNVKPAPVPSINATSTSFEPHGRGPNLKTTLDNSSAEHDNQDSLDYSMAKALVQSIYEQWENIGNALETIPESE